MSGRQRPTTVTRRQLTLELAAEGLPPQAIAEQLGLSPRSIRRYLASPDARTRLQALRDERLRQLAARALTEAGAALATLRVILEDETVPPQARVAAAGKLLDVGLRLYEAAHLVERVEVLEELIAAREER